MKIELSLAGLVSIATGVVIGVAMLAYAWVEHSPSQPASITEHLLHAVMLAGASYAVLHLVLRTLVGRPLRTLSGQLYRLALGHIERVEVSSPVREVREMVDAVNLMVQRIEMDLDPQSVADLRVRLESIRKDLARLPNVEGQALGTHADALQRAFCTLVHWRAAQQAEWKRAGEAGAEAISSSPAATTP